MSNSPDYQSSQSPNVDSSKSAEDHQAKLNGIGEGEPKQNGISEKHSSSSSSKKHSDGHHKSSSSSDKHRSSSSSKHGSSSSSSSKNRDGHHSSSSSSSKHRDSSSSSSKHRESSSSSKHSSSSSSKSKDGHKSSSSSSSSHRDKDGKSSSSSGSSSHKHKDGHSSSSSKHSSSSSSKHRDGSSHSSSKDKDRSSDKDKHREKSSSSSSKDKDKHKSSSSSSSHDKHRSSSDKHKSSSSSSSSDKHKSSGDRSSKSDEKVKVKEEVKEEVQETDSDYIEPVAEVKKQRTPSPVKKEPQSPVKKEYSPVKREAPVVKSEEEEEEEEEEESEDDDKPLSVRINESRPQKRPKEESDYEDEEEDDDDEDDDEDVPLLARAKQAKKQKLDKKPPPPPKVEVKKETKPVKKEKASAAKRKGAAVEQPTASPTKKKKKEEEEQEVWKWWEEQPEEDGKKWTYLEHKGPVFAPLYEPLPKNVRFYYEGKPMELTPLTQEVGTFYGRMLDHDYTTRDVFNNNFFKDWKRVMTDEEKKKITDLKKCNFTEYNEHFKKKSEERKAMSKEEKQRIKKENEEITKEYGFCIIDKHKEKIGNFKIEPPSLFRGRGDHPKQGMLKRRVVPEDVIINCSKDSVIPKPPEGHKWKEVRHDNSVTWLASWTENIQGSTKYIMLNAASKLKGQKDWQKYETARKLHKCVDKIRANYQEDWKSKEMRVRQRAVALYFIDKLALRAGNEKDGEESADTVGCCSLRVEHIKLHEEKGGKPYVVEFDFLGKDSIRYQNSIPVEKRVFKNLQLFMENKQPEDDLFDRLNTVILNKHLQDLMEGLTAKVFRTYNASKTLSEQLELLTNNDDVVTAKMLSYNRANRAVAILCNHQRAVPKTFEKTMENLQKKIDAKNEDIKAVKKEIKGIKADYKQQKSVKTKTLYEKKKKTLARLEEQLTKLEVDATDRDENKEIALSTSKLNYLDPRISVAWCKKFEVPIEKVYNKTQRDKFRWAIDMATEHFKF